MPRVYTHTRSKIMANILKKIGIKNIVITSIVVVTAMAGGLAVGIVFGKLNSKDKPVDFEAPIDTGLEQDYDLLMQRYAENPSKENFRPFEIANIAWLKFGQEEHTHSVAHCVVTAAIVKQHVYTHDVRVGDSFYSESVFASSLKKGGFRFYQKDGIVNRYTASNVQQEGTATWNEDTLLVKTTEEHEAIWGKTVDRPVIYIFSDKTVLEEKLIEEDDKYVIDMELEPTLTTERYSRQMVGMSSLSQLPVFHKVHIAVTCDKDYNIDKMVIQESYTVYVVGRNDSDAVNTVYFHHNSDETIPDLTTDYDYGGV